MRRIVSSSSGLLWKGLTDAGLISSSSLVTSLTRQHHQSVVKPQALLPLGLKLYATLSDGSVGDAGGSVDVAATLAMECGSVPASRVAAMLETHTSSNGPHSAELIKHLAASACYNNAASLRTCTPSELSRIVAAMPPSSSAPLSVLCILLQQRSPELTADQLSTALCNLLHLSQLCVPHQPKQQSPDDKTPTVFSVCCSLATMLLHPSPNLDLSTTALVQLITACFRSQHLLPGLDLHVIMEDVWTKLLEERKSSTRLQQLPADEFVQLLAVGSRLQTPSGIHTLNQLPQKEDVELAQVTATANLARSSGPDTSKRWQHIMQILQQRVSTGDFNVAQLGELAKTLNKRTGHWVMHDSISGSDDDPGGNRHNPPLTTVIRAITQQLPSAPLEEAAMAARSLGQARLLGEDNLLQVFDNVLGGKVLDQLSHAGLTLWLEAISRAVVDSRRSCNSSSEEAASRMLSSAFLLWLAQGASQGSSMQQLVPLFWALGRARRLPPSDLRVLLLRCDPKQWLSVGSVEAVQLVYACLKVHFWETAVAAGLRERVQDLLPIMDVHTLIKLIEMLNRFGRGSDAFSQPIWQALLSALPNSTNQDMWSMFKLADKSEQTVLRDLVIQQATARLNGSPDAMSQQPLLFLICTAAADDLINQTQKQDVFQRVRVLLCDLQDHQVASLAFHLPSLEQTDQPLADRIAVTACNLLPSSSLTFLARTLSGVNRLRGNGTSENYSIIMSHIAASVTDGCSHQDLFHITAWMLEDSAVTSSELAVAVASAVNRLALTDIAPNLASQLAQLISRGVISGPDMAPVLLQALPHREFVYTAHELTTILSMLSDEKVATPHRFIIRLLILMKHLRDPKHEMRPLSLQLYNIFAEQQQAGSSHLPSVQSHQNLSVTSEDVTAEDARTINMPLWLRGMVRDPTVVLMDTADSQLCKAAQKWVQKFPELGSLLYARLQLIAAQRSPHVSVTHFMVNHGCNECEHPDLVALIASSPAAVVQGERKRFIL